MERSGAISRKTHKSSLAMKILSGLKKFFTRDRVFDALFLTFLVVIYTIVSFINLGEDKAPQTFYKLQTGDVITIKLEKEIKAPKVALYTGITRNDFELSYATSSAGDSGFSNASEYKSFPVDGPFRWRKVVIDSSTKIIFIKNTSTRAIELGEIGVFNHNLKVPAKVFANSISFSEYGKIDSLTDEQNLVTLEESAMNSSYFDEVYFAQTAYQYATEQWGYETTHPPLGKILQSIPIKLLGKMTPLTWRMAGNIAGILIIIAVYFLTKEIFKKSTYARIAAILVSLSGLHFVQTRIGTVDSYLCLFTILSFLMMFKYCRTDKFRFLLLSGICFGAAFSVKWSGAFAGFALFLFFVYHLYQKIKMPESLKINWQKESWKKIIINFLAGGFCFLVIPVLIYFSSYLLFPKTTLANSPEDVVSQSMNLYNFHSSATEPHPYASKWYTWPIAAQPMLYSLDNDSRIELTGNLIIAYTSIIAMIITLYFAARRRDKNSIMLLISYLSLWLPYALIGRTMFLYHYLPASIFAIIAIVNVFYLLPKTRKFIWIFLLVSTVSFILKYPIMAGL